MAHLTFCGLRDVPRFVNYQPLYKATQSLEEITLLLILHLPLCRQGNSSHTKQTQQEIRFFNEAGDVQARLIRSWISQREVKEVWRFGLMVKLQTKALPWRWETRFYSKAERKRRVNEIFIWSIVMLIMQAGIDCVDRQSSWSCETMLLLRFFFPSLCWGSWGETPWCLRSPPADILPHNNHPSWSFGSPQRQQPGPWMVVYILSDFTVSGIRSQRYSNNKTTRSTRLKCNLHSSLKRDSFTADIMNMSPARDETPHRSEICALNHLMKALVVVPQPQETTSWSFHPPEFR